MIATSRMTRGEIEIAGWALGANALGFLVVRLQRGLPSLGDNYFCRFGYGEGHRLVDSYPLKRVALGLRPAGPFGVRRQVGPLVLVDAPWSPAISFVVQAVGLGVRNSLTSRQELTRRNRIDQFGTHWSVYTGVRSLRLTEGRSASQSVAPASRRVPVSDRGTLGGLSQSVSQFGFAGSSTSL